MTATVMLADAAIKSSHACYHKNWYWLSRNTSDDKIKREPLRLIASHIENNFKRLIETRKIHSCYNIYKHIWPWIPTEWGADFSAASSSWLLPCISTQFLLYYQSLAVKRHQIYSHYQALIPLILKERWFWISHHITYLFTHQANTSELKTN